MLFFRNELFRDKFEFDEDLSGWDTSAATDMAQMFKNNYVFDQDLSGWDTSFCTSFQGIFNQAYELGTQINDWDTSKVTRIDYAFGGNQRFISYLDDWDTTSLTNMQFAFYNSSISQNLVSWDTRSDQHSFISHISFFLSFFLFSLSLCLSPHLLSLQTHTSSSVFTYFYVPSSKVTNMMGAFGYTDFNHDLCAWDTASVTDMSFIFYYNSMIDQNLGLSFMFFLRLTALFLYLGALINFVCMDGWCREFGVLGHRDGYKS